ncbi:TPA: hypothetical protein O4I89_001036 [Vibrio cholerae]|uniref:hypothetical protein n=1 Tax=Vibrio cholerae TaxID=666 RepID=UPI00208DA110|nr:hypothetical protein [Vibrio cholerae]EJL3952832.1 hypothetical protein [Vibrio cholerae]MCU4190361.1 hypothetical protein [Vibrio cholerae]GHW67032.1 hypothetical protein VCSRO103_2067 [Vibrio cholerae]HCZ9564787.1 hypothetical protein [Vibrio cholerae]HCZ9567846.1 hypothetical protein [Vibrio cholerae]
MTCFKTGWAALLDVSLWVSWANIGTCIVAIVAAGFAYNQWISSKKEARRATAYSAYSKFLELCQQSPDFAYAKENKIKANQKDYIQYRWFVAQMLFAFEQILDVLPNDEEWKVAISNQLKKHVWHLKGSGSVERKEWCKPLQALIEDIID